MKIIPYITIVLWLIVVAIYKYFPAFFFIEFVQYPLIVLLSILLPVSFWLKVKEKRRFFSLLFVAIFFINIGFLFAVIERNFSVQKTNPYLFKGGISPLVAQLLNSDDYDRSKAAARFIYQQNAIEVPFKISKNSYIVYSPSKNDNKAYQEISAKQANSDRIIIESTRQMISAFFYLILHAGVFLGILVYLNFSEG